MTTTVYYNFQVPLIHLRSKFQISSLVLHYSTNKSSSGMGYQQLESFTIGYGILFGKGNVLSKVREDPPIHLHLEISPRCQPAMEITQKANANWMICCCAILLFTACSRFRPSDAHVNLTMSFPLTHSCCSWRRGRFSFAETQITRYAPGTQVFFSLVLPDSNSHLICLNAPPRAL